MENENIDWYAGSVTATADDAEQVDTSQVEITSSGTTTIQMPGDEALETENEVNEGEETPVEESGEDPAEKEEENDDTPSEHAEVIDKANKTAKTIETDLTAKGVDFRSIEGEFEANGKLSDASYEALNKAGYPKELVDGYIAGLQASAERFTNAVLGVAGGQQEYTKLLTEIQAMGESKVKAYNDAVNSGNMAVIEIMLEAAKQASVKRTGTKNPSALGTKAANPQEQLLGFTTQKEMIEAINDPRYRKDSTYRKQVEQRMALTPYL